MQYSMENDPIFPFAALRVSILRLCALREQHQPGQFFTTEELAESVADTPFRVKRYCLDLLKDGLLRPHFSPNNKVTFAISQAGINLLHEYETRVVQAEPTTDDEDVS